MCVLLMGWLTVFVGLPTQAATWIALNDSSFFTGDVIFENDADPAVSLPIGSRYFYADALRNNATYPGLNASGLYSTLIAGETVPFQLQPYTAHNLAKIGGSGSLTYNITDGNYSHIALAAAAGNVGAGNDAGLSYILNYTDSTSTGGTLIVPDWGNPTANGFVEIFNVGRANVDAGNPTFENNNNFSIFGIIIPADSSKTLSSITFGRTTTSGEIGFFAFAAAVVPEPSRALMSLAGLVWLLFRRRR